MKIAIGSDHRGFKLKERITKYLISKGHEVSDEGTRSEGSSDYPVYAEKVGRRVAAGLSDKGVLVCGSGMGMCMAANKIKGVRSSLARNPDDARITVMHNDANVICLGSDGLPGEYAEKIIESFITAVFEGGRHARRVSQIGDLENKP